MKVEEAGIHEALQGRDVWKGPGMANGRGRTREWPLHR